VKHADLSIHPIKQLKTLQQQGVEVGLMLVEMLMLKNPFEFCRGCKAALPNLPIVLTRSKQSQVLEPERRWARQQGVQDLLAGFSDDLSLQEIVEKVDQLFSSVCRSSPQPNAITQRLLIHPVIQQLLGRGQASFEDNEPTLVLATSGVFKSEGSGQLEHDASAPHGLVSDAGSHTSQVRRGAAQDLELLSRELKLSPVSISQSEISSSLRSSGGIMRQPIESEFIQTDEDWLITTPIEGLGWATSDFSNPSLCGTLPVTSKAPISGFRSQATQTVRSTYLIAPNDFLRYQLEIPLGKRLIEAGLLHPTQVSIILEDQRHQPGLLFGELLLLKGWLEEQPCWFFVNLAKVATSEEFRKLPIGQKLKLAGLVNDQQINKALRRQQQANVPFGKLLFQQGFLKLKTVEYFARL